MTCFNRLLNENFKDLWMNHSLYKTTYFKSPHNLTKQCFMSLIYEQWNWKLNWVQRIDKIHFENLVFWLHRKMIAMHCSWNHRISEYGWMGIDSIIIILLARKFRENERWLRYTIIIKETIHIKSYLYEWVCDYVFIHSFSSHNYYYSFWLKIK